MDTPPMRWAAALMPESRSSCLRRLMGSSHHPVGPDRYHSVIVPLRPQRGSRLPTGAVAEGGHQYARWRQAGVNSRRRLNRMDWASLESANDIPCCPWSATGGGEPGSEVAYAKSNCWPVHDYRTGRKAEKFTVLAAADAGPAYAAVTGGSHRRRYAARQ
jgi:hypothetical protein